ncbi:CTAG/Pcc1 family [Umbelopsis sp. PMI_123]|nr:CTAG/Pcc1 family [Umbelopsis sp. PMI_123]
MSLSHSLHLEIPFPTPRLASIAQKTLSVDKELKVDQVKRTISANGDKLTVDFDCSSVKMLRVSATSFFEMLTMVTSTMEQFDIAE